MKRGYNIIIIFFTLLISGCYYNYATNEKSNIKTIGNYGTEKGFRSILFIDEENSSPFIITITHLSENYSTGKFESTIEISDFLPKQEKKIIVDSIILTHSVNGEILKEERIFFQARKKFEDNSEENLINLPSHEYVINGKEWSSSVKYTKQYNLKRKYRKIKEHIYLEIIIDGKKEVIERDFIIKYKLQDNLIHIIGTAPV